MKCIAADIVWHDEPYKVRKDYLFAYEWTEEEEHKHDHKIFYFLEYKEEIKDFMINKEQLDTLRNGSEKEIEELMKEIGSEFSVLRTKDIVIL